MDAMLDAIMQAATSGNPLAILLVFGLLIATVIWFLVLLAQTKPPRKKH